MPKPLVSVIMPSLNQRAFIASSVESVLSQRYSRLELIVADGGSSDGTQAWLAQKQSVDPRLRWYSGSDGGPADALNSAVRKARGTLIGWLNADDLYTAGAIERAVDALLAQPNWLMVYGHGEHIDLHGGTLGTYPTLPPDTPLNKFAEGCFICQPTVLTTRTLWLLLGPLDDTLRTAFDFDYWLRAFRQVPGRIGFLHAVQAQSRLHADCITLRERRTVILEGMKVLARHLGHARKEWLLTYAHDARKHLRDMAGLKQTNDDLAEVFASAQQYLCPQDKIDLRRFIDKQVR